MKKLVIGVLAMIMILAIAGIASAHDNWSAISSAEITLQNAGWAYSNHVHGEPTRNVPVVLSNGGMALTDVLQYTVWFIRVNPNRTAHDVDAAFSNEAFAQFSFAAGDVVSVTVRYVTVGGQDIPVQVMPVGDANWARQIQ
jgi:hypothetical protein